MSYTDRQTREIVALVHAANSNEFSPEIAERLNDLLAGASFGDVRYGSQFEQIIMMAFDPENGSVKASRSHDGLHGSIEQDFVDFQESYKDKNWHFECWGRAWPWKKSISHDPMCIHANPRPEGFSPEARVLETFAAIDRKAEADKVFTPNLFQRTVLETMFEGEYADLADITGQQEFYTAIEDVGDSILRYLIIEFDESQGCEDRDEAVRRIEQAMDDLSLVQERIEGLPLTPRA